MPGPGPTPPARRSLATVEKLSEIERSRVAALLRAAAGAVRFVGYRQAEGDCERLAARILKRYPADAVAGFEFRGVPRGGLIVLGMLSYWLRLDARQLHADDVPARQRPLVLVDDCALTGRRFGEALAAAPERPVIFAHLYSHPRLRAAVAAAEDRVEACLAARDLATFDPGLAAGDEERWLERLPGKRYWLGNAEPVCFAWSEPDRLFWNPAAGLFERGWRFAPPDRCLKHRTSLGPAPAGARRSWRVPAEVAVGEFEGRLRLYQARLDRAYLLSPVAAELWRALACWGDPEAAAARLTSLFEVGPETARADARAFVQRLAGAGLLESVDD